MGEAIGYGFDLFRQMAIYFTLPIGDGLKVWHLYAVLLVLGIGVGFVVSWYRRS